MSTCKNCSQAFVVKLILTSLHVIFLVKKNLHLVLCDEMNKCPLGTHTEQNYLLYPSSDLQFARRMQKYPIQPTLEMFITWQSK